MCHIAADGLKCVCIMDRQQWPVAVPHQIVTQAVGQATRVGQMQDAISRLEICAYICVTIVDRPTD